MIKRALTSISLIALLSQPVLAQGFDFDVQGQASGSFSAMDLPELPSDFPAGAFPPGQAFPGGVMPGQPAQIPAGAFPGGQYPPQTQPQTQQFPWWWFVQRGNTTGRGVGRRYGLPQTSTSSVDLNVVDLDPAPGPGSGSRPSFPPGGGFPMPGGVFPGGPSPQQPIGPFPGGPAGGLYSGPNPSDLPNIN